jgi:hypothetical protein
MEDYTDKDQVNPVLNQTAYGTLIKSSGELEPYVPEKLIRSIKRAGGDEHLAMEIAEEVNKSDELKRNTDQIHAFVFNKLRQTSTPIADRYNLKRALIALGPSGFPFEKYVAEIFKGFGYKAQTNIIAKGKCVDHEIDVVIENEQGQKAMVEVKFHNASGYKTNVKVPLYVKARFDDVKEINNYGQAWIVTNTKFTSDSIKYAECNNIKLISWEYPAHDNLAELIDKLKLHPITALSGLSDQLKKTLMEEGVVLCKQLDASRQILIDSGLTTEQVEAVVNEANSL